MQNPTCPNFNRCGGCLYLNMPFQEYNEKKKNFITSSFLHEGINVNMDEFVSIRFGTRRRATFAFSGKIIGFNSLKSHTIIPLDGCPALTEKLSGILPYLKDLCSNLKKKGDISLLDRPEGLDIHIKTQKKEQPSLNERMLLAEFTSHPDIVRLSYNFEPIVEKIHLSYPIDMFLQPSVEGEQALIKIVLDNLGSYEKVIDLFCGAGTFTKPLLQNGIQAVGYDCASDSVALLGEHAVKRDLFRNPLLAQELNDVKAVIMDPPRAGAKEQTKELAKSSVEKIIMISCNPITAARDVKHLISNGWTLTKLIGVDQFIYTNHVEVVAILEK